STRWRTNVGTSSCTTLVRATRYWATSRYSRPRATLMAVPRKLSKWTRTYVDLWIEKDRSANIPIDPRPVPYAAGRRSPYEPHPTAPATWKIHAAADPNPPRITGRLLKVNSLRTVVNRALRRLGEYLPKDLADEALTLFRLVASCTLRGTTVCLLRLVIIQAFHPCRIYSQSSPGTLHGGSF